MSRLTYAGLPLLAAAAVASYPVARPAAAEGSAGCAPGNATSLTVAATTDVHGRIRGWDYYDDRADSTLGLTRAATIVDSLRGANAGRVVLVDAGDLLQGTPLAYVAARVTHERRNPIIAAMNAARYDAAVVGNHEFNYGVPYLNGAIAQARFPFLAANVYRADGKPAYTPSTVVDRGGVRVAIVGATTPGSNLWDSENLKKAKLHVGDIVPAVRTYVERARRDGADVVVVVLHSGLDEASTYDTVSTGVASENVAKRVAAEVPGIDVVVYGHSHKENAGQLVGHTLLLQPKNYAASVGIATVPLTCEAATRRWSAGTPHGAIVKTRGHAESAALLGASERVHREAVQYATAPIGSTPDTWSGDSSRVEDTPLIDFILAVERKAANADLASSAAFDTRAKLGPGPISISQLVRLYPYDNTLRAVRISGTQLRQYLEHSSRYYLTTPTGAFRIDSTVAGYNFDIVSGVDYTLDLTRPVGERVTTLTYKGKPVAPTDSFTLALSNYRQMGGGGFAMLAGAPVVYDRQEEIRQLLIDEVRRRKTIRKSDYFVNNWQFAVDSTHSAHP